MSVPDAVLIDTGPLVALVDSDDSGHLPCTEMLKKVSRRTKIITVMSVLTEAFYLVSEVKLGTNRLFDFLDVLHIEISHVGNNQLPRIQQLMIKYADLPMDFADATLVATAESKGIKTILTLDRRGFGIYKPVHTKRFTLLP